MHSNQAEYLLLNYPSLSAELYNRQQTILQRYRQRAFSGGSRYTGRYSDPTGSKAVRLLEAEEEGRHILLVGQWINTELRPRDRPLLINRWRRHNWPDIARRQGVDAWECIIAWNIMIIRLADYLKACAGHACGVVGAASANGQM